MKLFLLIIIIVLIGILVSLFTKEEQKKIIIRTIKPMWWGPAGKLPPNPPARWGYRRLCRRRLNC
tara:strand:+ start:6498 stop:6692 length:195 start_codon:yes stop_codon:yes gene_type:complete